MPPKKITTIRWHGGGSIETDWIKAAALGGAVIQLQCVRCGLLVGQVDRGGFLDVGEHEAPCGLPCTVHIPGGSYVPSHPNEGACPRCRPQKCPVCKGRGVSIPPGEELSNTCFRCKGLGLVPGSELFDE